MLTCSMWTRIWDRDFLKPQKKFSVRSCYIFFSKMSECGKGWNRVVVNELAISVFACINVYSFETRYKGFDYGLINVEYIMVLIIHHPSVLFRTMTFLMLFFILWQILRRRLAPKCYAWNVKRFCIPEMPNFCFLQTWFLTIMKILQIY